MRTFPGVPLRIITKNIRYATTDLEMGEESWHIRRRFLINELSFNTRHCAEALICLQEVLHIQLVDILHGMNATENSWDFVGVGRDDGKMAGEYSPIFYRPDTWELISWRTVWLSETPEVPSKSWDAASIRILTIARFAHKQTRKHIIAMSTHLDDTGHVSRLHAARIIKQQIRQHMNQGPQRPSIPAFLAGDFNSEPDEEAYLEMTDAQSPMQDVFELVPADRRYGETYSYTSFDPEMRASRIDFLFLSKAKGSSSNGEANSWSVAAYGVLPNRFEDGVFNSDHRAVVADIMTG